MLKIPKEKEIRLKFKSNLTPSNTKGEPVSATRGGVACKDKLMFSAQSRQSNVDKTTVVTEEVGDFESLSLFHSKNNDVEDIFLDEIISVSDESEDPIKETVEIKDFPRRNR